MPVLRGLIPQGYAPATLHGGPPHAANPSITSCSLVYSFSTKQNVYVEHSYLVHQHEYSPHLVKTVNSYSYPFSLNVQGLQQMTSYPEPRGIAPNIMIPFFDINGQYVDKIKCSYRDNMEQIIHDDCKDENRLHVNTDSMTLNRNNNNITSYFTRNTTNENQVVETPIIDHTGVNKVDSLKSLCMSLISNRVKFTLSQKMKDDLGSNNVVNLSDFVLLPRHVSLLSKGLTFCPTPGEPCMGDLRRDLDDFHRKVKLKAQFLLK